MKKLINLLERLGILKKKKLTLNDLKDKQKTLKKDIRKAELKEKRLLKQKERLDKSKGKTNSQNLEPAIEVQRSLIRTLETAKEKVDRSIEQMELSNALQQVTKLEKNSNQLLTKMNKSQKILKKTNQKIKELSEHNKNQKRKSLSNDRKHTLKRTKKSRNLCLS